MLLLPPKALLALCVLAIISARSAVAASSASSSDASSHRSHPSKYFLAPYSGSHSDSSGADTVSSSSGSSSSEERAKNVAFRSARISAAVADRVRRKRAAQVAPAGAPTTTADGDTWAEAVKLYSASTTTAANQADFSSPSQQELDRRARIKEDSARVARHLSKQGLVVERGAGLRDERFERKMRAVGAGGAKRGRARH